MKFNIVFLLSTLFILSCSHQPTELKRSPGNTDEQMGNNSETPDFVIPPENEITVEFLQNMLTKDKDGVKKANYLFNRSIKIDRIPEGYSAGRGARVFGTEIEIFNQFLNTLVKLSWKGKIFFTPTEEGNLSMGLNRIRAAGKSVYVPMASFVTKLVDHHEFVEDFKGQSLVILNYAHPLTEKKYIHESILNKNLEVYDLMAPIKGKYGTIFIGKTWAGKYDKVTSKFTPKDKNNLTAWFFLDFNPQALADQDAEFEASNKTSYNPSTEKIMNPIPRFDESNYKKFQALEL